LKLTCVPNADKLWLMFYTLELELLRPLVAQVRKWNNFAKITAKSCNKALMKT